MATPLNRVIIFVGDVGNASCSIRMHLALRLCRAMNRLRNGSNSIPVVVGSRFIRPTVKSGPIQSPTGGPNNPHKIGFQADDVAAERARLVSKGVAMGVVRQFGSLTLCDGHDPEGHVFQLSNQP